MKVLITGSADEQKLEDFRVAFPQVDFVVTTSPEQTTQEIVDADALFGWIVRDSFLAAGKLRWIQSHSAGVEWLRGVPELVASDVVVTNTRGAHAATIAEHAFAMLLYHTRQIEALREQQRRRQWKRPVDLTFVGLSGLTLGVVGLGRIGTAVADRAHGFDMKVIAVDVLDVPKPGYVSDFWLLGGLPNLLRQADVVAVSTPFTPETKGMLGPAQLALMKPSAFLLVMSRGGIIDEDALAAMLKEGRLAGAGLDVTSTEPLPAESPLWDAPNLVITPHCSGSSRQTTDHVWGVFQDNLARFLADQPLTNLVDKKRGFSVASGKTCGQGPSRDLASSLGLSALLATAQFRRGAEPEVVKSRWPRLAD